jgi:hypothetical protein
MYRNRCTHSAHFNMRILKKPYNGIESENSRLKKQATDNGWNE